MIWSHRPQGAEVRDIHGRDEKQAAEDLRGAENSPKYTKQKRNAIRAGKAPVRHVWIVVGQLSDLGLGSHSRPPGGKVYIMSSEYTLRYPRWAAAFLLSAFGTAALAQQPRQYTKEDYAKAEKFMGYNVTPLAYAGVVRAKWLDDGRFWYRDYKSNGWDYVIVDPANKTKVAGVRSGETGGCLKRPADSQLKDDARHLAISEFSFPEDMPQSCWSMWARGSFDAISVAPASALPSRFPERRRATEAR